MSKYPIQMRTVVLLHGIGHNRWFMWSLEYSLKKAGYKVINLSYPWRRFKIQELATWLKDSLEQKKAWHIDGEVHFVAHSMGGLVLAQYLDKYRDDFPADKVGHVVMLGTPFGGSEVADRLKDNIAYRIFFGKAGQELTTITRKGISVRPWYKLGIIAGTKSRFHPFGKRCIETVHDGCVSVKSTKIKGSRDHIEMPVMHSFLCWNKNAQKQILYFLKQASFDRS